MEAVAIATIVGEEEGNKLEVEKEEEGRTSSEMQRKITIPFSFFPLFCGKLCEEMAKKILLSKKQKY